MKKILLPLFGLLLAMPVLASLTACDTSSKSSNGSSVLGGGKLGGGGVGGNNGAGGAGGTAGTPGNQTGTAAALVGIWGFRNGNRGVVFEFEADGKFEIDIYTLTGQQAEVEANAGTYTATGTQIQFTTTVSTSCPPETGTGAVNYQLAGNQLQMQLTTAGFSALTKNDAPNPMDYNLTYGCFAESGAFTPSATQP